MPMTDSLAYLHGTGSTGQGSITSTANVVGSGSQAGTILTITTVTSGQFGPGQQLSGTNVPSGEYIVANGSGSGTAGTYSVSVSSTVAPATVFTATPNTLGDVFGSAGSQYSNLELDFGAPSNGFAFPNIGQFPSLTEKTASSPPEIVGQGGVDMGIHIIVTGAFNNLTSINFQAVTSANTNALFNAANNPIAARTLTLAQLQMVGAHFYFGVQGSAVLEFLRFYGAVTGTNPTAGTIAAWYGPRTGGEQ